MKKMFLAIVMAVFASVNVQGSTQITGGNKYIVGYRYTDDGGKKYEVEKIGNGYLLAIDDSTLQIRGYCMLDSAEMELLRGLLNAASLDKKKQDFRSRDAAKEAKKWTVRIRTSDGNEDDDEWTYHRGYIDDTAVADAEGMRRCMDMIAVINGQLLEKLQRQKEKFGYQVIACMEHSEYGYMYMMVGENGERISPREDFWYFNYGDHAVVEKKHVREKTTHELRVIDRPIGDLIGETVQVERYVKPDMDIRVLDAPSSVYTFYFFDGRRVSFNHNYMERYEGEWIVTNPWQVEEGLK